MTVCVLYQPSDNVTERIIQVDSLLNLTNKFYLQESDIPEADKPRSYLTVNAEIAKKILQGDKKIPKNFGIKVKVEVEMSKHLPVQLHEKTLDYININGNDIVAKAYIQKYKLQDNNTIVILWDQQCKANISGAYLNTAIQTLTEHRSLNKEESNIVIFLTNPDGKPAPVMGKGLTVVSGLPDEQLFNVLTQCKNHVLVGNNIGLLCATLTEDSYCVYPHPWKIEDTNFKLNDKWHGIKYNWPYTKYFDRVYFINLDRRTDRKLHMEQQLNKLNLSATRIQAFDGKTIKWRKEFGVWSKYWNEGAFACCLSHRQALTDAYKNGFENILILEDDAVLQDNFFEVLDKAWQELPENWHMLYLAANHGAKGSPSYPTEKDKIGEHLFKLKGSLCSHAIILNKVCYPAILNHLAAPYGPIDVFYSLYQQFFPCYVCSPGLAKQMAGHSDIVDQVVGYSSKIDYINYAQVPDPNPSAVDVDISTSGVAKVEEL